MMVSGYKKNSEASEYPVLNDLSCCALNSAAGSSEWFDSQKLVVAVWAGAESELGSGWPNAQSPGLRR